MSKWIVSLGIVLLVGLCAAPAHVADGWKPLVPHTWGESYADYARVVPGLTRSYAGQNKSERARIAKYTIKSDFNGEAVRVVFSFTASGLYEISYRFGKGQAALYDSLRQSIAARYGQPYAERYDSPPLAAPFEARSVRRHVWFGPDVQVALFWAEDRFSEGVAVNRLSVSYRFVPADTPLGFEALADDTPNYDESLPVTMAVFGAIAHDTKSLSLLPSLKAATAGVDIVILSLRRAKRERTKARSGVRGAAEAAFDELDAETAPAGPSLTPCFKCGADLVIVDGDSGDGIAAGPVLKASDGSCPAEIHSLDIRGERLAVVAYAPSKSVDKQRFVDIVTSDLVRIRNNGQRPVVIMDKGESGTGSQADFLRPIADAIRMQAGMLLVLGGSKPYKATLSNAAVIAYGLPDLALADGESAKESLIFYGAFTKRGSIAYRLLPVSLTMKKGFVPSSQSLAAKRLRAIGSEGLGLN